MIVVRVGEAALYRSSAAFTSQKASRPALLFSTASEAGVIGPFEAQLAAPRRDHNRCRYARVGAREHVVLALGQLAHRVDLSLGQTGPVGDPHGAVL